MAARLTEVPCYLTVRVQTPETDAGLRRTSQCGATRRLSPIEFMVPLVLLMRHDALCSCGKLQNCYCDWQRTLQKTLETFLKRRDCEGSRRMLSAALVAEAGSTAKLGQPQD